MYLFGLISGSILLALIFHDAFEVMLLPRRVRRKLRFITLLFRYTWNLWSWLAERMALGIRRDTFLSLDGPLSLVMLIGSWVIGLMVGFALIQCSLSFSAESVLAPLSYLVAILFSLSEPPVSRRCPSCDNRSLYWRRAPVSHFRRS